MKGHHVGGCAPEQRKVVALQEKAELLVMYHVLRSAAAAAHYFTVNELSIRTTMKKEKEIHEIIAAAMLRGAKTLHFLQNTFLCHIEYAAFMCMQDYFKAYLQTIKRFRKSKVII